MPNLEIQADTGGTLSFEVPRAPVSAATCSLNDIDGSEISTPAVTLPLSTTLSSTAAAGATALAVVSTAGVGVGDTLYLSNNVTAPQDGRGEWVRVSDVTSATALELFEGLGFDYESGDVLGGNILSASVSASEAATRAEGYEWRLSYRVTGEAADSKAIVQWDVVRNPWPTKLLTNWQLRKYLGEMGDAIMESIAHAGTDFEDDLEVATSMVKADIMERGYSPSRFRSLDEFHRPVGLMVLVIWSRRGENIPKLWRDIPEAYLDAREEEYRGALNTSLNINRSYDEDDSGVVTPREKDAKLGFMRMVR